MLFAMARDGKLPYALFGHIHPRLETPVRSIVLMGVVCTLGAGLMNLDQAAGLVNFGACLGFMAVNLSALVHGYRATRGTGGLAVLRSAVAPFLGFAVCLWIWLSVSSMAMTVGFAWLIGGMLYLAFISRASGASGPSSEV
jgi:putrescine importer